MIEHFSIRLLKYDPDQAAPFADLQKYDLLGTIWIDGKKYGGLFPVEEMDLKDMGRFFRLVRLAVRSAEKAAKKHFEETPR